MDTSNDFGIFLNTLKTETLTTITAVVKKEGRGVEDTYVNYLEVK